MTCRIVGFATATAASVAAAFLDASGAIVQDTPAQPAPEGAQLTSSFGPADTQARESSSADDPAADRVAQARRGVLGGPHDFSARNGRYADACAVCHVPHVQGVRIRAEGTESDVGGPGQPSHDREGVLGGSPLRGETPSRNRQEALPEESSKPSHDRKGVLPAGATALELYRIAGQRQVFLPDRYMPGATSLICLGCHDGTVARSTLGTSHALLAGRREGFDVPDGFVWRDHPIGVPYPADRKQYHPRAAVEARGVRLPDGRLECVSCHDPHNEKGGDAMLIMSNRRSALCLACHVK